MAPQYKVNEVGLKIIGSMEGEKSYSNKRDCKRYVHCKFIASQIVGQTELDAKHGKTNMKLIFSSLRKMD